jgi:hypothetical protein
VFKNKKTPLRYMCKGVDRSWTEDLLQAEVRAVQGTAAAWANTLPHRFKRVHFTGMLLHISVYIQSIFSLYSVYIQSIFSVKIAKMTFCTVQATAPTLHTRGCRGRRVELAAVAALAVLTVSAVWAVVVVVAAAVAVVSALVGRCRHEKGGPPSRALHVAPSLTSSSSTLFDP